MPKLFIAFTIIVSAFTARSADYIIFEDYTELRIRDRYQQELSNARYRAIRAYAPVEIIEQTALLGDQLTYALKGRIDGQTAYIITGKNGTFTGYPDDKYVRTFNNCREVHDTFEISSSRSFVLYPEYPQQGGAIPVDAGAQVQRIFKFGNRYFGKLLTGDKQYGWITIRNASGWHKKKGNDSGPSVEFTDDIVQTIRHRLTEINATYVDYFSFFNDLTGKHKSSPQWQLAQRENRLTCSLHAPQSILRQLKESSTYVAQEIENLFIGKPFTVTRDGQTITISAVHQNQ
ncbi:MAG: hypothetical protein GF398_02385 [Chitinivibrionales bacterium]|nr:hypothetical protein [Chitinivibrionales bacterium]